MTTPGAEKAQKLNLEALAGIHSVFIETVGERYGEEKPRAFGKADHKHGFRLGEAGVKSGILKPCKSEIHLRVPRGCLPLHWLWVRVDEL